MALFSAETAEPSCRLCGLLFLAEPLEIGRAESDDTICIICEAALLYEIDPGLRTNAGPDQGADI